MSDAASTTEPRPAELTAAEDRRNKIAAGVLGALLAMLVIILVGIGFLIGRGQTSPTYYELVAAKPGSVSFTLYCSQAAANAGMAKAIGEGASPVSVIPTKAPISYQGKVVAQKNGQVCQG